MVRPTVGSGRPGDEMDDFDVDEFLAQPLVARVATNGPTVRPVWFLWEGST